MQKTFQIAQKKTENLYICMQNCARLQKLIESGGREKTNEFSQHFREVYKKIANEDMSKTYENVVEYSRQWNNEVYVNLILQRVQRQLQNIIIRSLCNVDMETISQTLQPMVDIAVQRGQKGTILQKKITRAMIEHVIESHQSLKRLGDDSKIFLCAENWSTARKRGKKKAHEVISHEDLNTIALAMGDTFTGDNKEITTLTAMLTITFSDEYDTFPLIEGIFQEYCCMKKKKNVPNHDSVSDLTNNDNDDRCDPGVLLYEEKEKCT